MGVEIEISTLATTAVDLAARLPQRLAGLACDQVGEGVGLAAHDIGEAAHRLDAVGQRPSPPSRATAGADPRHVLADRRRAKGARQTSVTLSQGSVEIELGWASAAEILPTVGQHCSQAQVKKRPATERFLERPIRDRIATPMRRTARDLGVEQAPSRPRRVDRRPDRLDFVDQHRAGSGIGPIRMVELPGRRVARGEKRCSRLAQRLDGVSAIRG